MNDSFYHDALLALAKSRRDDEPLQGEGVVRVLRDNPLCGDSVALSARAENARTSLAQQTRGCILCEAATALMISLARDLAVADLHILCADAEKMFAGEIAPQFSVFTPVAAHPARRECVLLPFRALSDVLAALSAPAPSGDSRK